MNRRVRFHGRRLFGGGRLTRRGFDVRKICLQHAFQIQFGRLLRPRAVRQRRRTMQTRRALRPMAPALVIGSRLCGGGLRDEGRARRRGRLGRRGLQRRLAVGGGGAARAGSRGAISAMLPAAIRTPWLPSGKSNREAAAGRKPAGRRAKALQSLQPDGAVCRQPACEPRDLPPVPIGRSEDFFGKRCGIGGAEQPGAGRIGPQDPRAVGRPQPGGQGARRVGRQSRIAEARHLKFRIIHRDHMTVRHQDRPPECRQPKDSQANRYYRKPAAAGPRPGGPATFKAADNLNPAEFFGAATPWPSAALGGCKRPSRVHDREPPRRRIRPGAVRLAISGRNPCQRKGAAP